MIYKQQGFINAMLLFTVLALLSCSKEPICEKITGDLLIRNMSDSRQRVTVGSVIVVVMTAHSRTTVHDLQQGDYEVKAISERDGSAACVFVEIRPCEESEIVI